MFRFKDKRKKQELGVEIDLINEEIGRSKRFGFSLGVLVVELNDSVPRGLSKVMPGKTISFHVLKRYIRVYDKVVGPFLRRYYIILPQTDKNGVNAVKQRVYKLAEEHKWGDVLIGTAVYPEDGKTPKALLDKAIVSALDSDSSH